MASISDEAPGENAPKIEALPAHHEEVEEHVEVENKEI